MNKAFLILSHRATAEEQEAISRVCRNFGWWHYFPDAWIIITSQASRDAQSISSSILKSCPNLTHYVFEIRAGSDYAGFAPAQWEKWLKEEWKE